MPKFDICCDTWITIQCLVGQLPHLLILYCTCVATCMSLTNNFYVQENILNTESSLVKVF